MKKYAIIVAGGSGRRMKAKLPKQFIKISGKPILWHTIKKFHDADPRTMIVVVLPKNYVIGKQLKKLLPDIPYIVIAGGDTRFESVKNGLIMVEEKSVVAIHDA